MTRAEHNCADRAEYTRIVVPAAHEHGGQSIREEPNSTRDWTLGNSSKLRTRPTRTIDSRVARNVEPWTCLADNARLWEILEISTHVRIEPGSQSVGNIPDVLAAAILEQVTDRVQLLSRQPRHARPRAHSMVSKSQ